MKRTVRLGAVVMVVAAACGGTGSTDSNPAAETGTTTKAANPVDTTIAQDQPTDSAGVSMATVVIDGESYEYQSTGFPAEVCNPDFFGGFQAVLTMVDENGERLVIDDKDLRLALVLIPEGVDDSSPSTLLISIPPDHEDLVADSQRDDRSGMDSFTIDGDSATGTATFVDINAAGSDPVSGTFTATCVEE